MKVEKTERERERGTQILRQFLLIGIFTSRCQNLSYLLLINPRINRANVTRSMEGGGRGKKRFVSDVFRWRPYNWKKTRSKRNESERITN